jgi:hypothetical protein
MTISQWTRHLVFTHVPHIVRQRRVFQEFLLQAWNEVENLLLQFFCQLVGPEDADNLEGLDEANGGDSDSGRDNNCEGHASFITAACTGGATPSPCMLRPTCMVHQHT